MMDRLLEEGWITLLLILAIFVGNVYATSFGGPRGGLKVVGLGLLAPWMLWIGLVAWCWVSKGVAAEACGFTVGAGFGMVGLAGSFFWLVCAVPGLLVGLIGHWWLRKIAPPLNGKEKGRPLRSGPSHTQSTERLD